MIRTNALTALTLLVAVALGGCAVAPEPTVESAEQTSASTPSDEGQAPEADDLADRENTANAPAALPVHQLSAEDGIAHGPVPPQPWATDKK